MFYTCPPHHISRAYPPKQWTLWRTLIYHKQPPTIGRLAASSILLHSTANCLRSGESLLREHDRFVARFADNLRTACALTGSRHNSKNVIPSLAEECADLRALDIEDKVHEQDDLEPSSASPESEVVDQLSSLLDDFHSDFHEKLGAFRKEIQNLRDCVHGAYAPRERAHLQRMYCELMVETFKLAVHQLLHDLTHVVSSEDNVQPSEEYCPMEPSFTSSRGSGDSMASVPDQKTDISSSSQPQASLILQSKPSPILASKSPRTPYSSTKEAASDHQPKHKSDCGQAQHTTAEVGNTLRSHQDMITDRLRFCGESPKRTYS
jgi:hypothetical protein